MIVKSFLSKFDFYLTLCLLLLGTIFILWIMGRPLYCTCGHIKLWHSDVFNPQVSQHLTDWYTFTHIIHGILLFVLFFFVDTEIPFQTKLLIALGIECSWEILENTEHVIEYYRNNTMAVNFTGDTIVNSFFDVVAMILGFLLSYRYSIHTITAVFLGLETLTLIAIRDSFLLNVLMLVYPIEFIKHWQTALM